MADIGIFRLRTKKQRVETEISRKREMVLEKEAMTNGHIKQHVKFSDKTQDNESKLKQQVKRQSVFLRHVMRRQEIEKLTLTGNLKGKRKKKWRKGGGNKKEKKKISQQAGQEGTGKERSKSEEEWQ